MSLHAEKKAVSINFIGFGMSLLFFNLNLTTFRRIIMICHLGINMYLTCVSSGECFVCSAQYLK